MRTRDSFFLEKTVNKESPLLREKLCLEKDFIKEKTFIKKKNFSKGISESPWGNEVKTEFVHGLFCVSWPFICSYGLCMSFQWASIAFKGFCEKGRSLYGKYNKTKKYKKMLYKYYIHRPDY